MKEIFLFQKVEKTGRNLPHDKTTMLLSFLLELPDNIIQLQDIILGSTKPLHPNEKMILNYFQKYLKKEIDQKQINYIIFNSEVQLPQKIPIWLSFKKDTNFHNIITNKNPCLIETISKWRFLETKKTKQTSQTAFGQNYTE